MAEELDDITVNWEEGGVLKVEELDKAILTRGAWTTILFKFRELGRDGEWGAPKFTLRRYQKRSGVFRQQSKFNISSLAQAKSIVTALDNWVKESEAAGFSDD